MIKRIFFGLFFLIVFTFVPKVYALDEKAVKETTFATSYDVVYDVSEDGITTVTEKVALKNLTSQFYASLFKLTIGATEISDIKASDSGGPMQIQTENTDSSTTIAVHFNQQVAGLNKSLPWTLQFKSKDFAEKIGKVWEVRAPKINSSTNLENYNLTISVPVAFGEPTLISPTPKSQTVSGNKLFLTFDKNQLKSSGVSANFGAVQVFDFDLSYHLQNKNIVPILTHIALPPDTSFQDVIFQRITPIPLNVTVDEDGNFLAWYKLSRGEKIDVKVLGSAKLYTTSKAKDPSLSEDLRKKYTAAQKYWEKDNPAITDKLREILGDKGPTDNQAKIKLIYAYVVNSLKYNSSRLKGDSADRYGAVTILNNPDQAVCMEFTDLFIALARAAGIPARELDGFAYTANPKLRPLSLNKDILHAWPEYWDDKKGWVMVDPTWENTTGGVDYFNKLDLNHFTFAIKGLSSTQPITAGSYKIDGEDSQDVKVTLSEADFLGKPQINLQIDTPDPIIAGLPAKIKVKISNLGNSLYQTSPIVIGTEKLDILDGNSKAVGPIPAFGTATFEFNTKTKSLLDSYQDKIIISLGNQKFSKEVEVRPLVFFQPALFIIGIVIFLMIAIYVGVLGVLLHRRRIGKKTKKA